MTIELRDLETTAGDAAPVEIVERKGRGHPDSLCDGLAEALSAALGRWYRDRFGLILHHNVDKMLLCGGSARPAFGGGGVERPIGLVFAGQATRAFEGVEVPVDDLAVEATHDWLARHMHALDPRHHVRVESRIRPGSADLVDLYRRQKRTGEVLANDTSYGMGYAPMSRVETLVLEIERRLTAPESIRRLPVRGEDVKVMAVRHGDHVQVTVACAFVDRHLDGLDDYLRARAALAEEVAVIARELGVPQAAISVNTADDPEGGSIYMTVTGTSAESGDDGQVGRGNRVNGLITPFRPMSLEAAAGKNPVSHVGKLYNVAARRIAERLVDEIPELEAAQCALVSRIGQPIRTPQLVDVRLRRSDGAAAVTLRRPVSAAVEAELDALQALWRPLLAGDIAVF